MVDVVALVVALIALAGVVGLTIWATDASPKAIRNRYKRRPFICACGHDYVFHKRDVPRTCTSTAIDGFGKCGCQRYSGEIPPPDLDELLGGQ